MSLVIFKWEQVVGIWLCVFLFQFLFSLSKKTEYLIREQFLECIYIEFNLNKTLIMYLYLFSLCIIDICVVLCTVTLRHSFSPCSNELSMFFTQPTTQTWKYSTKIRKRKGGQLVSLMTTKNWISIIRNTEQSLERRWWVWRWRFYIEMQQNGKVL